MPETDDIQLLREFAECQSEAAFAELVRRHVNLVYSCAFRQTGNAHHAEEITQAVFIILARKAASLGRKTILSGWLYQTARLTAANFLRTERRRAFREQEAYMQSLANEPGPDVWRQIAPLLEDAMAKLNQKDRDAVVLRFLEGKSLGEVGAALGASEDAVKMRVNRALEKLRKLFAKRGVALAAGAVAGALAANPAAAAPAGLAATVSAVAAKGVALGGATSALVQGTLKIMAWTKYKLAAGLGAAVLVAGVAITTVILVQQPPAPPAPPPAATAQPVKPVEPQTAELREPFTPSVHMTLGVPPGAVALQPDGKIVIGTTLSGFFIDEQSGVLGSYRRAAMRLQPDGLLDRSFFCQVNDVNASDAMRSHLEIHPDGRMLMTGLFKSVNDIPRPGYAVLLPDGRVDESFEPFRGLTNEWNGYFHATATRAATWLGDDSIAVMSGAIERTNLSHVLTAYRLDPAGRLIPRAEADLGSLEFSSPSGLALTLGPVGFWARKPVDWTRDTRAGTRPAMLAGLPAGDFPFERWQETPSAADAAAVFRALFAEMPIELCRYAVRLPDGGVVLAVRTGFANGSRIGGGSFMHFDKDWRPDLTFTNHYEADVGSCITLKLQKDGKILVAGLAGKFNGEDFPGLIRLEKDGSIDRTFHCETTESNTGDATLVALRRRVIDLAVQDDGRIVIGGFFTKVNGVECPHLARLNPDGSVDETFRTPFTTWEGLKKWRRVPVRSLAKARIASGANAATKPGASEATTPPQTVLITSLQLNNGVAVIQFTGNPRQVYILQAGNSLDWAAGWTNISTNRANAAGTGMFRDETAKDQPMRFYRIAIP